MAEKIEMFAGWDWDGSAVVGRERNIHIDKECTVVVHDGKTERVFTESEVRAMLDEIHGLAQAYWDNAGHGAPDMLSASEVAGIAERGGIVLDPA